VEGAFPFYVICVRCCEVPLSIPDSGNIFLRMFFEMIVVSRDGQAFDFMPGAPCGVELETSLSRCG